MRASSWHDVADILKKDGIAVVPTDTLYGVVGRALSKKAVEKIYRLKGRDEGKPCIVLISSFVDLKKFGITLEDSQKEFLESVWPGKISVILSVPEDKFSYLHRGTKTIAFRMIGPRHRNIFNIIKNVGPLVAPSANPQGKEPALRMGDARKYFEESVDIYLCGGTRKSKPSTLVEYKKGLPAQAGELIVLRKGAVNLK